MTLFGFLLVSAGLLFGHAALWVAVLNRSHAVSLSRSVAKAVAAICAGALVLFPLLLVATLKTSFADGTWPAGWSAVYLGACALMAAITAIRWAGIRRHVGVLRSNHSTSVDIAAQLGRKPVQGLSAKLLARVPANQAFTVSIHEKVIEVPRLPSALAGLSIAHLSDFHFTGQIEQPFFEEIVRLTNQLDCDLVALTGDFFDRAACIPWAETLGRLQSRHGRYFVLGNHDPRTGDVPGIRRALTTAGLIDLDGCARRLTVRGTPIVLAGKALSRMRHAAAVPATLPADDEEQALKILLTHSPDPIDWAREHDFDLMLAGHTHGGQIRIPGIGAIVCPSRYGISYAAGVYHCPPLVMHVTRGISGVIPLRLNCAPEIAKLVLQPAAEQTSSASRHRQTRLNMRA